MKNKITLLLLFICSCAVFGQGFITSWKVTTNSTTIIIPTAGTGYNYSIDWGDGSAVETAITGNISHTYSSSGTYSVEINGDFPRIDFRSSNSSNRSKFIAVNQWGDIQWSSMNSAFTGCTQLEILATDNPDLSNVTDMSHMFESTNKFNQDISNWDVSTITNMSYTFSYNQGGIFNQDLSSWDVSSVTDMSFMFFGAILYNQNMSNWNVSNVTTMKGMFRAALSFNKDISNWDVSVVNDMSYMFDSTQSLNYVSFNQDISSWNVSNVTKMDVMFSNSTFNQPIGIWNVSNVTSMARMFENNDVFNQDISTWNMSNVLDSSFMFHFSDIFNQDIGIWDMGKVINMSYMFAGNPAFNQNIGAWNTSSVDNMTSLFQDATNFNQDIGTWNTSSVYSMKSMFSGTTNFNQNIGSWDTSSLLDIDEMFHNASNFNQDISAWNVSQLYRLDYVFLNAISFDQSLGTWDISGINNSMFNMFNGVILSTANYDDTLIGWATLDTANGETKIPTGVYFYGGGSKYCNSDAERTLLIDTYGWTINDGGIDSTCGTSTWYQDSDNDTFGNLNISTVAVSQPTGYVLDNTDCDDAAININPNATEICDGIDNNCDGQVDEGLLTTYYADTDSDGFGDATNTIQDCGTAPPGYVADNTDCDDSNAAINPNATEIADNGIDEDCDGADAKTWYQDSDSDTFGNPSVVLEANTQPSGYVTDNTDCDDTNGGINPGETEISGNGIDEDCDGSDAIVWYQDSDGDGFGNLNVSQETNSQPTGYVADNTDCDDNEANAYPGNTEVCDGIDNNCDGQIDEGVTTTFYADSDGDGFGDINVTIQDCSAPAGYVADNTDCDDNEGNNYPGNTEVCDGIDNDCDGQIDEGVLSTFYADTDADGFGDANTSIQACSAPTGYVADNTDCDDTEGNSYPGNTEVCDGIDNNCDGQIDENLSTFYADSDSDGYGDANTSIEACSAPEGYVDDNTDCDDNEGNNYPGNTEVCDGIDNDCDGEIDEGVLSTFYADSDGDGFGDAGEAIQSCSAPSGYVSDNGDCDDGDSDIHPDGNDIPNDGIDHDCSGSDFVIPDTDNDGVLDNVDNCIDNANPNQSDKDNDGIGDVCDQQEIVVPKGFSPNSDGINDTWVVENIQQFPKNNIKVFNRWGNKVYEASNYQNNWDGISTNGGSGELPVGAYMYIIELNEAGMPAVQGWIYINY